MRFSKLFIVFESSMHLSGLHSILYYILDYSLIKRILMRFSKLFIVFESSMHLSGLHSILYYILDYSDQQNNDEI